MKQIKGFTNCNILTEEGLKKTSLEIKDGKIAKIGKYEEGITLNEEYLVLPGFIDQHVHGAAGSDAMDGTKEDLKKIACALASEGTVAFLATTMTQSVENITKALEAVKEYVEEDVKEGAEVLGVHLEGPFISLKHIGAQPLEYVAKPSVEVFEQYQKASGNNIKLVSLAVEEEGALELVEHLAKNGVVASVGHTDATAQAIQNAIKKGLKNVTHTFNAMKPLHHREIGTVGSALLYNELNCELICDGIHVSLPAINLLRNSKPADKLTLVTDAMRAKHMPDGEWVNTPLRPFEASGTSGMSANMNGALHLSIFDGWTVEGTFNGINGYTVEYEGLDDDMPWEERHWKDHECVMDIIENQIIPTYYNNKEEWARLMRQAIRTSEAYFNSDRMVIEYYNRLYAPIAHDDCSAGEKKKELNVSETPTFDAWTYSNIK